MDNQSFDFRKSISLENKVAVISGAASGIGRASVDVFTQMGASVVAVDINKAELDKMAAELSDRSIFPFHADVSSRNQAEAMIDFTIEKCGKLDILFNNAGITDDQSPVGELTDESWEKVFAVNTNSVMYACRKAVSYYLENNKGGVIINTASLGGLYGGRAGVAYTASKHAVIGITKNIAIMYADAGIRCNAICPGSVNTGVITAMMQKKLSERGTKRMRLGMGLSPRMGEPYELANAALFLASDASSYLNGEIMKVDGGWSSY